MPSFRRACLIYFFVALPGSTIGLLWAGMRADLGQPVGALGIILVVSTGATVVAGVVTGIVRLPITLGIGLAAVGIGVEAGAETFWVFVVGSLVFGSGFGIINSGLNAYAAQHFGARDITWLHASYGLGAICGPLLVTTLLSDWRVAYLVFAALLAVVVFGRAHDKTIAATANSKVKAGILVIAAVESGIETGAGVWGYLFLTAQGVTPTTAGLAVSAYWATMFLGRVLLGPIAERVGARTVLGWAVVGVACGAGLMMVPGAGIVAMMVIGLAAAPVFPLLALTTNATRAVAWQAAASSMGSAVLPAGMGIAMGTAPGSLAPMLLGLSLAMCLIYARQDGLGTTIP